MSQNGEGIEIREAINQGFIQIEMATRSSNETDRIYNAPGRNASVLKAKASQAVDNYLAAISCFLRVIPYLNDPKSAKLIRDEVDKMLAKLNKLRGVVAEAKKDLGEPIEDERDSLTAGLKNKLEIELQEDGINVNHTYDPDDPIEVYVDGKWKPGVIGMCNQDGTYEVNCEDGTAQTRVTESRIRRRKESNHEEKMNDLEYERKLYISEIVESERLYVNDLRDLMTHYLNPLANPSMWAGTRTAKQTVFSTKIISPSEMKTLFANIEEIVGLNEMFFSSLENRFNEWEYDQCLGDIFLQYGAFFKSYSVYAGRYSETKAVLETLKLERPSFIAVLDIAAEKGIKSMDSLLQRPVSRISDYKYLLKELLRRTPKDHKDHKLVSDAYFLICKVDEYVTISLSRLENQATILDIQNKFKPTIPLVSPSRIFKKQSTLYIVEAGSRKERIVWLFNDIIVSGRKSEWLAVGFYRHVATLVIQSVRDAKEYGPLSFEIIGHDGSWTCFCKTDKEKGTWLRDMAEFLQKDSIQQRSSGLPATDTKLITKSTNNSYTSSIRKSIPPPPPKSKLTNTENDEEIPEGWIKLYDQNEGKDYYYNEKTRETSWDLPSKKTNINQSKIKKEDEWKMVRGKYDFKKEVNTDLPFSKDEYLYVLWTANGLNGDWIKAKNLNGIEGLIPCNFVELDDD